MGVGLTLMWGDVVCQPCVAEGGEPGMALGGVVGRLCEVWVEGLKK